MKNRTENISVRYRPQHLTKSLKSPQNNKKHASHSGKGVLKDTHPLYCLREHYLDQVRSGAFSPLSAQNMSSLDKTY